MFEAGEPIRLCGFTSTSLKRNVAMGFAMMGKKDSTKTVLYEIEFKGNSHCFHLNSSKFSAFPGEKEVLITDGIPFKILSFKEDDSNKDLYIIKLQKVVEE